MTELLEIAEQVAGWALPGEQLEVFLSRGLTTSVRARSGDVERVSSAESSGAGIRVIVDGRQGFASAGTLDETVLKESLEDARDNAAFTAPDEHAGLAAPDGWPAPALSVCDDTVIAIEDKVARALELDRLASGRAPGVTVYGAAYSEATAEQAVVTTTGIRSAHRTSHASLSLSIVAERDGDTQMGSGWDLARSGVGLDPVAVVDEAFERTMRLLGATQPRSSRVTVVLDPSVTASFLAVIGATLSGESVLKGRSPFAGRIGESVANPIVTLVDDPTDPASAAAADFDDEGLAHRRTALIEGGHLTRFLYDATTARRAGTASTASAVRGYTSTPSVGAAALTLVPGRWSQEELIAEVGSGIYVQSVSGLHSGVNPVSGDFSVGATGLMIRDGALAEPVREMTIASTLQRMLLDVALIGGDLRWQPAGHAGLSLAIGDVTLSGA